MAWARAEATTLQPAMAETTQMAVAFIEKEQAVDALEKAAICAHAKTRTKRGFVHIMWPFARRYVNGCGARAAGINSQTFLAQLNQTGQRTGQRIR